MITNAYAWSEFWILPEHAFNQTSTEEKQETQNQIKVVELLYTNKNLYNLQANRILHRKWSNDGSVYPVDQPLHVLNRIIKIKTKRNMIFEGVDGWRRSYLQRL